MRAAPPDVDLAARVAELERRLDPRAYTVRQVAERLHLSVTRVNELIRDGDRLGVLPSYKIGGARRVDPGALADFLAERQRPVYQSEPKHAPARVTGRSWLEDFQREAYGDGSTERGRR